jgi:competence ComEA-like helix-hairpin-helix protein
MCARRKRGWKKESRDALGVVVLVLVIIIIRMLFTPTPVVLPEPQLFASSPLSREQPAYAPARPASAHAMSPSPYSGEPFAFDPNTLDSTGFRKLGFSASQTQSIIKYRTSGAVFRKPEDFSRSYVVSEQMYKRLAPYIRIHAQPQLQPPPQTQLPPPRSTAPFQPPRRELIEINGADTSLLIKLRGIGPYYAQRIAQYRDRLGGFVAAEQIMEVEGMDEERFALFASQIEIDHTLVRKIDMKSANQSTLGKHPYIGPYAARWIVHYREQLGDSVCTPRSLVHRNLIKPSQAKFLEHYVE